MLASICNAAFAQGVQKQPAKPASNQDSQKQDNQKKDTPPVELGRFDSFNAYMQEKNGARLCYLVAQPSKMEPANVRRDPVYFFVTHRPKDKIRNEISISAGYPFKVDAPASLEITPSGGLFSLVTSGEGAWLSELTKQNILIEALRKGREVVMKGTSHRGTATSDTYSLSGFAGALDRINQACQ